MLYKEWCNYLEEDFFPQFYARGEAARKVRLFAGRQRPGSFRTLVYAPKVTRMHYRFYYFRERALTGKEVYSFSSEPTGSERSASSLCGDTANILGQLRPTPLPSAEKRSCKGGVVLARKAAAPRGQKKARGKPAQTGEGLSLDQSFRKLCRLLQGLKFPDCSALSAIRSERSVAGTPPSAQFRKNSRKLSNGRREPLLEKKAAPTVLDLTKKLIPGFYVDEYELDAHSDHTHLLSSRRNAPFLAAVPRRAGEDSFPAKPAARLRPGWRGSKGAGPSSPSNASLLFLSAATQFRRYKTEDEFVRASGRPGAGSRPVAEDARPERKDSRSRRWGASTQGFLASPAKQPEELAAKRKKLSQFIAGKLQPHRPVPLVTQLCANPPRREQRGLSVEGRLPVKTYLTAESPRGKTRPEAERRVSSSAFKLDSAKKRNWSRETGRGAALARGGGEAAKASLPPTRFRRSQTELRLQQPSRPLANSRSSFKLPAPEPPEPARRTSQKRRRASCAGVESPAPRPAAAETTRPGCAKWAPAKRFQLKLSSRAHSPAAGRVLVAQLKNIF